MKGLSPVVKGLKVDAYDESCEVDQIAVFVPGYYAHLTGFNILMPGLIQTLWKRGSIF
ncbi:hypothetical protein M3936_19950 [Sutcliffiella horikoshii]|nr:hypothetical protein [Sutcliffiella horikoshii]